MQHWKRTIELANHYFAQGDYVDAREHYLQALALAQVLFDRWPDPDEAVAAYVISHHNLADVHLRLEQPEESAEYLCAIHERLLESLVDERLSPALRQAVLRHSGHSYRELLGFVARHGHYPRTLRLLKGSRHPLAQLLQRQALMQNGPFHGVH
ncbi:hypothetical protein DN824_15660 [Stutzerimonas nosocomialis]|uniref:Tetratricopeptide repeat protein n=1 Tax=Stutzerimonas nosocomialis TaxID=1056496 RepID=A0A5R9QAG9_9GAMM|nr:tetratricopeptide repeat protein [Stutzerimonas nosocomialis]TLX53451.1 hypothetical protein DN826_18505 [Stutzerimonas nosocomialis]TLX56426.1 hypothetical protein DN824_15660 [Stutzerimonas nosocomialis]TLX61812.1 hypothetical protein DN820_19555 [Stutzerimonas nosocomialis]